MEYLLLGKSGIVVSRICFGTLTLGPLQANLPLEEGAFLLEEAVRRGINFFDTAKSYNNYPYLKILLHKTEKPLVIATKSYDYTAEGMAKSLEEARKSIDRDYIDLFLLHEQENALTLEGHRPALEYLLQAKNEGKVRAVGVSSHSVAAVKAAAVMPEIDVIHPLLNFRGLGITNGSLKDMLDAVNLALSEGKGVYAMKAIGGGNLLEQKEKALRWAFSLPVSSVAIGMQRVEELDFNISLLEGKEPAFELKEKLKNYHRRLLIENWCQGCGNCVERCRYQALSLINGKAVVDESRCILCSYCAAVCVDFCIKVI